MNVNDETVPPPPPPPPPHAGPPARRLTRSTDDKVLTGLCGGLGRFFGVDPVIFRIAFVVLALAGGTGVLLYLAGWLLIPDDQGVTEADKLGRTRGQNVALAVLVVVGACLLMAGFADDDRGDFPLALVLIAIGAVAIWSRQQGGTGPAGPPSPPTAPPSSPAPADAVSDAVPGAAATATPVPPLDVPPPPPAPPAPRSVLVPVTLSLLLVLTGVLGLIGVSLVTGLALALLLTGVALAIGAWRGRARPLIPVALVLTAALATASFVDVPLEGGAGDRIHHPQTLAELRSPYRLGMGELQLDLSDLDLAGRTVDVVATTGIGHLQVIVPSSVPVVVTGKAGLGEVDIFDSTWGGTGIDRRVARGGPEEAGRLVLRARVGIGQVEVLRAAA
jgi:phage shock protein PspC (stress-responsive transcriptional regulator)